MKSLHPTRSSGTNSNQVWEGRWAETREQRRLGEDGIPTEGKSVSPRRKNYELDTSKSKNLQRLLNFP